jgi:23S rRNA (cytosine1962-C5)-methyltransferase
MGLILSEPSSRITLRLARDLVRVLKRGNPWVYREALRSLPDVAPGTPAVLLDNKRGRPVARGFYDPTSAVAFRACDADSPNRPLDDSWAAERLHLAWRLRQKLFGAPRATDNAVSLTEDRNVRPTTAFRLANGEGDGMPGLVVDLYSDTAVMKLDGPGPCGFWNALGIANWLASEVGIRTVIKRPRERDEPGRVLIGAVPTRPVAFLEHGLRFTADVMRGQKTGFFLDQRDNRVLVRRFSAGATVLNLFGYTGGFSVAAGVGGAIHVTTVDSARPAIEVANVHWHLNGLATKAHAGLVTDAFEFLAEARGGGRRWDIVVSDPPSFAPSKTSLEKAVAAYRKLAADAASVTAPHGLLALASCSSHVDLPLFLETIEHGLSQARRSGTVLALHSQPPDHPTPLALPEFRYLKFVLLRLA